MVVRSRLDRGGWLGRDQTYLNVGSEPYLMRHDDEHDAIELHGEHRVILGGEAHLVEFAQAVVDTFVQRIFHTLRMERVR